MPTISLAPKTKNYDRSNTEKRQARKEIYNTRLWCKLRQGHLIEFPICELCEKEGRVTPAVDIHHKKSFMDYEGAERLQVAYDPTNLVSLCKDCHAAIHSGKKSLNL